MRLTIAAAVLLVGCSTTWQHGWKGEQEFHRDNAQCMAMAGQGQAPRMMVGSNPVASGFNQGAAMRAQANQDTIYRQCMLGNGWRPS